MFQFFHFTTHTSYNFTHFLDFTLLSLNFFFKSVIRNQCFLQLIQQLIVLLGTNHPFSPYSHPIFFIIALSIALTLLYTWIFLWLFFSDTVLLIKNAEIISDVIDKGPLLFHLRLLNKSFFEQVFFLARNVRYLTATKIGLLCKNSYIFIERSSFLTSLFIFRQLLTTFRRTEPNILI